MSIYTGSFSFAQDDKNILKFLDDKNIRNLMEIHFFLPKLSKNFLKIHFIFMMQFQNTIYQLYLNILTVVLLH